MIIWLIIIVAAIALPTKALSEETGILRCPASYVGKMVPNIILPDANGQLHHLSSHIGRQIVLHFFDDQPVDMVCDVPFGIITLPGHTQGSVGITTPDNVLYTGDALFGEETANKHAVLLYTNISDTLHSLQKLQKLSMEVCALYHGGITKNAQTLAQHQEAKILLIKNSIIDYVQKESLSIDQLTQKLMLQYSIPNNIVAFTLTQTTLRAYLAYLEQTKIVAMAVHDGLLRATLLRQ